MKIEKNFTTGVLSGICGILVILVIMGSTTPETTTKFEFHDLGDTRGVIFNKVTGGMEYKEIRTEPLPNPLENISGTISVSSNFTDGVFYVKNSDW